MVEGYDNPNAVSTIDIIFQIVISHISHVYGYTVCLGCNCMLIIPYMTIKMCVFCMVVIFC